MYNRLSISLICLLGLVMLSSCGTPIFSLSSLDPSQRSPLELPHLAFEMERASFDRVYQRGLETRIEEDNSFNGGATVVTSPVNPRIPDAFAISERCIQQWISRPVGAQYGFARVTITGLSSGNAGTGYLLVSALTAFIPNFFGFPLAKPAAEVSLALDIIDSQGEILGHYTGTGDASKLIGFYYGKRKGTPRQIHATAMQEAWEQIYTQIAQDQTLLTNALLKAGPVLAE